MSRFPFEQMIASFRVSWSASPSKSGTSTVLDAVMGMLSSSDAAVRFRQSGDVSHLLGRLPREEQELLLDGNASNHLEASRGSRLTGGAVVVAQEPDDLPVLIREADADLRGKDLRQVLVPLGVLGQEALVVDFSAYCGDGCVMVRARGPASR